MPAMLARLQSRSNTQTGKRKQAAEPSFGSLSANEAKIRFYAARVISAASA
jgi:hypothetical protein